MLAVSRRSNFSYFDEGGIEGGAGADVGEALAGEGVYVDAAGVELGPVKARGHHAGG